MHDPVSQGTVRCSTLLQTEKSKRRNSRRPLHRSCLDAVVFGGPRLSKPGAISRMWPIARELRSHASSTSRASWRRYATTTTVCRRDAGKLFCLRRPTVRHERSSPCNVPLAPGALGRVFRSRQLAPARRPCRRSSASRYRCRCGAACGGCQCRYPASVVGHTAACRRVAGGFLRHSI
jgi:hypothetical protein